MPEQDKETSIAKITISLSSFYDCCLGSTEPESIAHQIKVLEQLDFELGLSVSQTESFTYGRVVVDNLRETIQHTMGNLRYIAQILDGFSALNARCKPGSVGYRGNDSVEEIKWRSYR